MKLTYRLEVVGPLLVLVDDQKARLVLVSSGVVGQRLEGVPHLVAGIGDASVDEDQGLLGPISSRLARRVGAVEDLKSKEG